METPSRRENDKKFDEILSNQRTHLSEYHANLEPGEAGKLVTEHNNMMDIVADLKSNSDKTVELLAGKEIMDVFDRPTGEREPGIADRVEKLEHDANGGKGFSVRTRDKIVIGLIAAIPAAFGLAIALLSGA